MISDLYNKFEILGQQNIQRRRKLEDYLSCLQERVDLEYFYSQAIEKIAHNIGKIDLQGTVMTGLSGLKCGLINRAEQSRSLADCIQTDIIDDAKQQLKQQNQEQKQFYANMKQQFRNVQTMQLDKKKNRMIELAWIEECNKHKYHIQQHNNQVALFNEEMNRTMQSMQQQEQWRIQFIKDSIYKILVFEVSQIKNIQYDTEKISRTVETIDYKVDIDSQQHQYIYDGLQKVSFNDQSSFVKCVINEPPQIMDDTVQQQIQKYVDMKLTDGQNQNILAQQNVEIVDLMIDGFNGLVIDFDLFRQLVQTENGRQNWNVFVKRYRNINKCQLDLESYNNVVELSNIVLDECQSQRYQNCYEHNATIINVLQQLVRVEIAHPVWKQMDYWKAMVHLSICEEIKNKLQIQSKVDKEQLDQFENNQKTIVFSYLASLSYNMFLFKVDQSDIKYILKQFVKYYNLWDLQKQDLMTHIGNFGKNLSKMNSMTSLQLSNLIKEGQTVKSSRLNLSHISSQKQFANQSMFDSQSRNSRKIIFKNVNSSKKPNIDSSRIQNNNSFV